MMVIMLDVACGGLLIELQAAAAAYMDLAM